MNVNCISCVDLDWMELSGDGVHLWVVVKMIIDLYVT